MIWVVIALAVALLPAGAYLWLLLRTGPAPESESVSGRAYRVGASRVYRLPADNMEPSVTVVAMHGFLQSPAYFTALYEDMGDVELILVGSGDYHAVFSADEQAPSWASRPDAPVGTIAHDAGVLRQAVTHLARGRQLWIHGHSRGGAVAVEAARGDPHLFRQARFLLEAPVLPGGGLFQPLPKGTLVAVPWMLPLWRRQPLNDYIRPALGRLRDDHKRRLMEAMPRNPRRALTVVRNIRDLKRWMTRYTPGELANLADVDVLITPKDRILDAARMERSARAGGDHVRVTTIRGVSHFIGLDQPTAVRSLIRAPWRRIAEPPSNTAPPSSGRS